ncbi:MAG: hypothetical protein Q8Q09_05130 [Deltaproteobacteria bacterium]|nr:hypothetical protein [Deltaproteobacteria bacterium]
MNLSPLLRFWFLATLLGCSGESIVSGPLQNRCVESRDCGPMGQCFASLCVARDASATVVLTAAPPSNGSLRGVIAPLVGPREISLASSVDLQMIRSRTVSGRIAERNGDTESLVAAQVRFVPRGGDFLQREISVPSTATATSAAGFTAELAPGNYEMFIEPRELESYPPLRRMITVSPGDPGTVETLNVYYSTPLAMSGFVIDRSAGTGVGGLFVRVVDSNGAALSARGRTTTGTGGFSIALSPDLRPEGNWSFEVSTGAPTLGAMGERRALPPSRLVYRIPRLALDATEGFTGVQARIEGLARFAWNLDGSCIGCVPVESSVEDPQSAPAARAQLYLFGTLNESLPPSHTAWFESYAVTDAAGMFRSELIPGDYRAIITPSDELNALTTATFRVGTIPTLGRSFVLQARRRIVGSVTTSVAGAPSLAGVEITAIALPTATSNGSSPSVVPRRAVTVTDERGAFELSVDPGRFLLVARPPESSRFASVVDSQVVDLQSQTEATDRRFVLQPPVLVTGRVLDPSGVPVVMSRVQAMVRVPYTTLDGVAATLDVDVASAASGSDGTYTLLLAQNPR